LNLNEKRWLEDHDYACPIARESSLTFGKTSALRESAYRDLFQSQIPDMDVEAIRLATNKSCVLGSEKSIEKFERRVELLVKQQGMVGIENRKRIRNQRL